MNANVNPYAAPQTTQTYAGGHDVAGGGAFLGQARQRLTAAGYALNENTPFEGRTFSLAARHSGFELTKFGFSEKFFVFQEFDRLDQRTLRDFSAAAFRYTIASMRIPLPRGFFNSAWCYAVAVARSVDPAALTSVQNDAPTKHWASAEIPVVFDASQNRLFYFEKTPLWGAAYYAGFRKTIQRMLT